MRAKKFSPKRTQTAVAARRDALRRLRERWEKDHEDEAWEPEKEPTVSPMLRSVEGGIPHILEALRFHDDEDARAFVELFDNCSAAERKHCSLEDIAFAAGIGSLRLAEVAQTAIFLYDGMRSKMLLASGLPGIVATSIRLAKTKNGTHDREMMLKAGGVLPVPKGAQIAIQNNFASTEKEEDVPHETVPAWKTAEERLREMHDMTEPKRLPSPEGKPISVGGRLDHMQEDTIHIIRGE